MRLSLCEAPIQGSRPDQNTGIRALLFLISGTLEMQETGPTVYSPYPKRLDGQQYHGQRVKGKLQTISTFLIASSWRHLFLVVEARNCLLTMHSAMNVAGVIMVYRS